MAKVIGAGEDIHQPFWDHLLRGIGISTLANGTTIFTGNAGQRGLTNMVTSGVFSSDSAYVIHSLRCALYFQSLADAEFNVAFGAAPALTNTTGTNARAEDLYMLVAYGTTVTFSISSKPQLTCPSFYMPAGGGPSGHTTQNARHVLQNGVASHESILQLGRELVVMPRQNIALQVDWFPFGRAAPAAPSFNGNGQGGAIPADLDPLVLANAFDGVKMQWYAVDGIQTRDVL